MKDESQCISLAILEVKRFLNSLLLRCLSYTAERRSESVFPGPPFPLPSTA